MATKRRVVGPLDVMPAASGKVEMGLPSEARGTDAGAILTAIVKVTKADYVPEGVTVRARFGPSMFTAELSAEALDRLKRDPIVASIGPAERLRSFKA